jgi:hypothetical protein
LLDDAVSTSKVGTSSAEGPDEKENNDQNQSSSLAATLQQTHPPPMKGLKHIKQKEDSVTDVMMIETTIAPPPTMVTPPSTKHRTTTFHPQKTNTVLQDSTLRVSNRQNCEPNRSNIMKQSTSVLGKTKSRNTSRAPRLVQLVEQV